MFQEPVRITVGDELHGTDIGLIDLECYFWKCLYESAGYEDIFCEGPGFFVEDEQGKKPSSLDD